MKRLLPSCALGSSLKLWARGRLDIGWDDLLFALWAPFLPGAAPHRVWPTKTPHLAVHSVRTAWDALLAVQNWAPGSEIILSEANISDMVRIIEAHGLVPVTVPLNPRTLAVEAKAAEAAVSERTRAILVSPLFGSRMNLESIGEVARRHKLLLVEDNAQAFSDTGFQGSPEADVALFSFGLIKTRTALSGAVVFARDAGLLRALGKQIAPYPRLSTGEFYARWARAIGLHGLSQPLVFGVLWRVLQWCVIDPDVWLSQMTRGMKGANLLAAVRRRPHRATLKLLRRRLHERGNEQMKWRIQRGNASLRTLPCAVGRDANFPFFWAFLVAVNDREGLIERARQEGFDVSFRASSVACHGKVETDFSRTLERVVFLPIGNPMPECEWERLMGIVRDFCGRN
ncbi:GDP-perosamine synthase [Abditibacteriota bacterium]|nr:GDP-perosamine synthase [Abditibacteriota bacterium]